MSLPSALPISMRYSRPDKRLPSTEKRSHAGINEIEWRDDDGGPSKGESPEVKTGTTCLSENCLTPKIAITTQSAFPGRPSGASSCEHYCEIWVHRGCLAASRSYAAESTLPTNDGNRGDNPGDDNAGQDPQVITEAASRPDETTFSE